MTETAGNDSTARGGSTAGGVPAWIAAVVRGFDARSAARCIVEEREGGTVTEVRLRDGRALMVKASRHDWAGPRFRAAERAARLLRERAGVVSPEHVALERGAVAGRAVTAYWRIPLPTLAEVWPALSPAARARAARSWGRLLRRAHGVRFAGYGAVPDGEADGVALATLLEKELAGRLLPAVTGVWPAGRPLIERLLELAPEVASLGDTLRPVLLHGDVHMGNVLCRVEAGAARCVGFIDLESASAGPGESDLACAVVQHSSLFGQRDRLRGFEAQLLRGYGRRPDRLVRSFFRTYHLCNFGFYSALVGRGGHARLLRRAAATELAAASGAIRG